jgi:hypothetical protein
MVIGGRKGDNFGGVLNQRKPYLCSPKGIFFSLENYPLRDPIFFITS